MQKKIKLFLVLLYDCFSVVFAWTLAYYLRFNFNVESQQLSSITVFLPYVTLVQVLIFWMSGLYRGVWRFASMIDLNRIIFSITISSVLIVFLFAFLILKSPIPRSVFFIEPMLLILIMGGSRFFYRAFKDYQIYRPKEGLGEPVILISSGQAGIALAKELSISDKWRVVGILDNDLSIQGREIAGIKILGTIAALPKLKLKFGITKVIIASQKLSHFERRKITEVARELKIGVLIIPLIDDLISGRISISDIRPVEVEDLLGRDQVELDESGLDKLIRNRVVLVSGAGGSIGSELCRQVARFSPSTLICLDVSEYSLYQIEQEFKDIGIYQNVYIIADVKNEARIAEIFKKFKPEIIFHAAAYKHVPLMERFNVSEALINNVQGTYVLAKAAKEAKVEKFILVSTDKAINPTNVMGASKRLAEMACQGMQTKSDTYFMIVRFGNVLGSSGSVIPKFRQQIASGGPVTVTHPEITRYFMSIPEAAQLVMQACLIGKGGDIFVLDMGEPVKIFDLAKDMIKLSGFNKNDIKIEFSGLRPGEKLYEELLADDETTLQTQHPKLRIASARSVTSEWMKEMLVWVSTTTQKDETLVKKELKSWVKEYNQEVKKNNSK